MTIKSYGLFCPLAMACEVVEPRWTLLILDEMWSGSTRPTALPIAGPFKI